MAGWELRRAELTDAAVLAACIDAAYAGYVARIDDLPAVSDGLEAEIENNQVWVGERDGDIVGGIVLVVADGYGVLANVAVAPVAQGTGLGRVLIERVEAEARRLRLATLRLSTHVEMPENVRLYQRLGWRETGRAGAKVMMEKDLVPSSPAPD